jgi:hypothetical protein
LQKFWRNNEIIGERERGKDQAAEQEGEKERGTQIGSKTAT